MLLDLCLSSATSRLGCFSKLSQLDLSAFISLNQTTIESPVEEVREQVNRRSFQLFQMHDVTGFDECTSGSVARSEWMRGGTTGKKILEKCGFWTHLSRFLIISDNSLDIPQLQCIFPIFQLVPFRHTTSRQLTLLLDISHGLHLQNVQSGSDQSVAQEAMSEESDVVSEEVDVSFESNVFREHLLVVRPVSQLGRPTAEVESCNGTMGGRLVVDRGLVCNKYVLCSISRGIRVFVNIERNTFSPIFSISLVQTPIQIGLTVNTTETA